MPRWKLTLEYDGSGFAGWQRQDNAVTVQQVLEEAIFKFCQEDVRLHVAGRTDAGVHALAQVAHGDIGKAADPDTVRDAINFHARPHKVAVLEARQVSDEFHARFSALSRRYVYHILNRRAPAVLQANYAWHIAKPLDVGTMQDAAKLLLGRHDFSTFRASNCQAASPEKTLDELSIHQHGEQVAINARARSFLYHQVRNMVGTLSLVGTGQWTLKDFREAFDAKDRARGGPTAPAQGLYFAGVEYS